MIRSSADTAASHDETLIKTAVEVADECKDLYEFHQGIGEPPTVLADSDTAKALGSAAQTIYELVRLLRRECSSCAEAHGYLSRVFLAVAPQCRVQSTLMGLCTQIDNAMTMIPAWQPIATAPKDGHDVLVYGQGVRRLAFWDHARGGGWHVWPGRVPIGATHWMPLPDPPQIGSAPDATEAERAGTTRRSAAQD